MALERQRVTVPMTSGHDASVDERVQSALKLLELINCEWTDRGAVRQRHGYEVVSHHVIGDGSEDTGGMPGGPRCLFSTGTELCAVRTNDLVAFDTVQDGWRVRAGCVSPWGLERRSVFRDEWRFSNGNSMQSSAGATIYAATAFGAKKAFVPGTPPTAGSIETTDYKAIVVSVTSSDGLLVSGPAVYAYSEENSETIGYSPRTAASGSTLAVAYVVGDKTSPSPTISALVSTGGAPSDVGAITDPDVTDYAATSCCHDMIGVTVNGTNYFLLAYVTNTGDVTIRTFDTNLHAVYDLDVGTFACEVALCANGATVYMLQRATASYVDPNGATSGTVVLRTMTVASNGTVALDPSVQVVVGAVSTLTNRLGIAFGSIADTDSLVATWREGSDSSSITLDANGAALDTARPIYNTAPVSRPWIHSGRAFVALCNSMPGDGGRESVSAIAVFDLIAGSYSAEARQPLMGAVHHIGQTVYKTEVDAALPAYVANAWYGADSTWRYCVTKFDGLIGGIDEVILTYAPPVGAVSVYRGTGVVGGAVVTWYDGVRAFELGAPVALNVNLSTEETITGTIALAEEGTYASCSNSIDYAGVVHRGLPVVSDTLAMGPDGFDPQNTFRVDVAYTSLTNRANGEGIGQMSIAVYKADGAGGFARFTSSRNVYPNIVYGISTRTLIVYDEGATPNTDDDSQLYTAVGEVEDIAPEGGLFPAVVAQRLHLAQCAAPALVPFSKRFYAIASGLRYAPEMNQDVLGFVLPEDDRAIAVAALDDKTVIFSTGHTYLQSGNGPDDLGQGSDYGPLQLISADVGCADARSVCSTPVGVFFQGDGGIYLLGRDLGIQSVGEAVRDVLDTYTVVTSAVLVASSYQVRFTVSADTYGGGGCVLVYDYRLSTWARWDFNDSNGDPVRWVGACLHQGRHYLLSEYGAIARESLTDWRDTFNGVTSHDWIPQTIGLGWIQVAGQSGWQRAWGWIPLLKQLGAFGLRAELYSDFNEAPDDTIDIDPDTIDGYPELPRVQPYIEVRRQECQAAKLVLTTTDPGLVDAPTASAKGFSCAGITLEVGAKAGKVKVAPRQRA